MAPVAYGVLASIAGAVVISVLVGVIIGTAAWRLKFGLSWGMLAAGVYLLLAPPLMDVAALPFAKLTASPLVLTLLVSFLAGRVLGVHRHTNAVWASLAAFGCGLVAATAYLFLFRLLLMSNIRTPPVVALIVDVCLIVPALRAAKTPRR